MKEQSLTPKNEEEGGGEQEGLSLAWAVAKNFSLSLSVARRFIIQGRIRVDGEKITEMSYSIDGKMATEITLV